MNYTTPEETQHCLDVLNATFPNLMKLAQPKEPTALDLIERAFKGYVCPRHAFRRIDFDEGALSRMGSVYGFIMGLKLAGSVERAEELAKHFLCIMDHLNNYGGDTEVEYNGETIKVPNYVVKMGDDGLANSFTLLWYGKPEVVQYDAKEEPRTLLVGSWPKLRYHFSFNGGLIYHGFNNETFTTRIGDDSNPWGIHT